MTAIRIRSLALIIAEASPFRSGRSEREKPFIALLGISNAALSAGGSILVDPGAVEGQHFHPKGKIPSQVTIELRNGQRASLPFEDERDFEEARRGFIESPAYKQIMADAGHVAWDMGSYEFLLQDKDFESIHPSLSVRPS